jgi:hypothetical protein
MYVSDCTVCTCIRNFEDIFNRTKDISKITKMNDTSITVIYHAMSLTVHTIVCNPWLITLRLSQWFIMLHVCLWLYCMYMYISKIVMIIYNDKIKMNKHLSSSISSFYIIFILQYFLYTVTQGYGRHNTILPQQVDKGFSLHQFYWKWLDNI